MLIRKSKHDEIVAAKDAEIAGLMKRLDRYTGPRERDAKGHYLPLKEGV